MTARIHSQGLRAISGIRRSFDTYYRDHARTARMDDLNARFIAPGALVFDIGAHVGDRTGSFLRLGADVVALEPQELVFRALRRIYGRCDRATLLCCAASDHTGVAELLVNPSNPTVSTVAADFVEAASDAPGWEGQVWSGRARVPTTTLDELIRAHGVPDFVKIDVEGHEAAVLSGLSTALPLMSFEMTTIHRGAALACVARLASLGVDEYNISFGEDHALRLEHWVDGDQMQQILTDLPMSMNSGDVYARRLSGSTSR